MSESARIRAAKGGQMLTHDSGGSVFRKIAMGSWRTASDPSVYGLLELDATEAQKYIQEISQKTGERITLSHFVGRVMAIVLSERPEINAIMRFSKIYRRKHVDLFYQVNVPGPSDDPVGKATLTGATIRSAESKTLEEIARELNQKSKNLRSGDQGELGRAVSILSRMPWSLIRWVLNITSFINYDLRINLEWAGMPRDPFGSVMITNIGALGGDMAWAPLVPYTRVPLLLTLGAVQDRAWVYEGKIEIRPILRVGITFDHRLMDGAHAAAMGQIFKKCFADPWKHL